MIKIIIFIGMLILLVIYGFVLGYNYSQAKICECMSKSFDELLKQIDSASTDFLEGALFMSDRISKVLQPHKDKEV